MKFIKQIVLLSILFNLAVFAQTGKLKGSVYHNGKPLPGVNVLLLGTTVGGVTDVKGNYLIEKIPAGKYKVRFSAVGFAPKVENIEILGNRTLLLNVQLSVNVIEISEVQVTDSMGQKQNDTRVSLIDVKPASAKILAGAVTDVFRTLQALPGVLAPNDFSSQLIVRGSGPDQNLIMMDDVEIFNPYRLYGVVSMFNPEAVSNINLITGGFPAMYGDRLSAVLDVTNKEGTFSKPIKGTLDASIVSANLVLEGKNPMNIPGSWLINSRRTYYDLIVEPFVKNTGLVDDNVSFPNFYDLQGKFVFGPFKGNKFIFNGIYSRDAVQVISGENRNTPDSVGVRDKTFNNVAAFAWHYTPKKNLFNKFIISYYQNNGDAKFGGQFLDPSLNKEQFEASPSDSLNQYFFNFRFASKFTFRKYSIGDKFTYLWGNGNEFNAGVGVDFMRTIIGFDFFIDPQFRAFINSNPNRSSSLEGISDIRDYHKFNGYIQNKIKYSDELFLQAGLRWDYYGILEKSYISPRLSLSYALNSTSTLRASWGIFYQSPGYEKLRDRSLLYDLNQQITKQLKAERAIHYVLSYEKWLNAEWRLKAETYYKKFDNLILPKITKGISYATELIPGKDPKYADAWTRPVPVLSDSITQIPVNDSFGESYGLELLLEKKNIDGANKLDGWVSYAYSVAQRFEYTRWLPFRYDQTHTLDFILNYNVNDWFFIGSRFQYGSGFPITEAVGIKPRIILADNDGDFIPETPIIATRKDESGRKTVNYDVDYGGTENKYSSRKPVYHRLDIRLNASTNFWGIDWVFYLDIINVYNHSNVVAYDYFVTEDLKLGRKKTTMFPILPTFGFNARF